MDEEKRMMRAPEEDTIDLVALFHVVWRKAWLVVLALIAGGGIAFGYTKLLVVPQYQSTSMLYVLAKSTSISSTFNLSINQQLTTDFTIIAKTRPVVESVINKLNLNADYETLCETISVSNLADSSILQVTVTNPDPQLAADISNAMADVIADQIATIMVTDRPSTMERAIAADSPVSPSTTKNVAIGALLAAFLVIGVIVIMYIMDDTIKTAEDVKKRLGVPVLASFPLEKGHRQALE